MIHNISRFIAALALLATAQGAWAEWTGIGSKANPYIISTPEDLLLLAHRVNGTNGETANDYRYRYFKLGADITFSHAENEPYGYAENYEAIGGVIGGTERFFKGDFDGDGHTVSGIRIRKTTGSSNYQGLFGFIGSGAVIHDVHLTDARITGNYCVGGIVGNTNGGNIMRCSVTDSYITATDDWNYGTICGITVYAGLLTNNYYHGCTVNGTAVTSGMGCHEADITANNGALPAYRLDLGANITPPPGTFAGQTEWLDTPPVNPRLAPENGFTQAGNHYFASGYVFTPGSTLASGAAQGYTPRATLGGQLLDLYTPTGDTDPLAGKAIARLTITADCDGKTLDAALISTGQPVTVAYINDDGTAGEASAIALDGHETVNWAGEVHLGAGTYYVGTDIAYANLIWPDDDITLILADGKTMTLNGNTEGIGGGFGYTLTIYGQSLDAATAGNLRYDGTSHGIEVSNYEQHSGNVSITTTNSGVSGINADVTLRGGKLTISADGDDALAINGEMHSILGGQLTAIATGTDAAGIRAYAESGTALTLGWTRPADRITVSSISAPDGGTVAVADGKKLHNGSGFLGGTLSDPAAALNGKTLRPAATATYTTADGTADTADAILLDASDNSLPAGNYLATGTLNYTHGITLTGDVTLILGDGATMTVNYGNYDVILTDNNLTICGQTLGTGQLNATSTNGGYAGIRVRTGNLTINGGTVTANGDCGIWANNNVTINGGNVIASGGDYGIWDNGNVTINGGNVTATATGENGCGIRASNVTIDGGNVTATTTGENGCIWANSNVTINGGNVSASGGDFGISARVLTLGWTNASDHIYANSYITSTGKITINGGHQLTDADGNHYKGNVSADKINGKHLYPYVETLDLAANKAPDQNYWTTFYCGHTDYQIDADENACAYTATYADGKLTLHRLGKEVPKATAVIIVADNNEVSMYADFLNAFTGSNDLRGVDVDTPVDDIRSDLGNGTLYVLGMTTVNNEQHFGFHRYTGEEMPARKAFVHVAAAPGSNANALTRGISIEFGDDATGIEAVEVLGNPSNQGRANDDSWYTINGVKLNGKPSKSGLYIYKGIKVAIK